MSASTTLRLQTIGRALARRARAGWHIVHLGATILVLAFAPATYRAPWRAPLAAQVVRAAWPLLPWFTLLAAIVSVVLIRIVLVGAVSLGLSRLALEMLVRVLVIELIPLCAAFAVATRYTVPAAGEMALARKAGTLEALRRGGGDPLHGEIVPRALAGLFAVGLLAAASGVVALVLAYLSAHGFSPWGLTGYTRLVGQIFSPAVTLVFVVKTCAFAAAVALIPLGSALHDSEADQRLFDAPGGVMPGDAAVGGGVLPGHAAPGGMLPAAATAGGAEVLGLVRMFIALLVIETLSLMGSYF